jgi:hypothetical protein
MKIKIGDKFYLQKYDVAHLLHELDEYPGSILDESFNGGDEMFFMSGPTDGYRFECLFEKPESVEWLMKQDWIVDYDEYVKMPLAELEELLGRLSAELSSEIQEFNAKDESYRRRHFDEANDKFSKAKYKNTSLNDLIMFRKGKAEFTFPNEYRGITTADAMPASTYIDTATPTDTPETSTHKKNRGFFSRLFRRNAQ